VVRLGEIHLAGPADITALSLYSGRMLTFLFTDIEASTRLWEENPDEMARALARHDAILNGAVEEAGGRVIKTTGDGMLAMFESVTGGISAAITSQRQLRNEPWGDTGPVRVRMGVHSGETENRDGDYFGPTMNRAARIMAAGHGGQVLISSTAAALAEAQLPTGAFLLDLGTHRLKDLTLPEHLYQLVHDDLESDFPAPTTLDSRPHNLPIQATEFLGRAEELATIQVMLESPGTRLVTIAGPGGAGKTRLGLQVAAEQADRFKDGVFFVDLSAERDPGAAYEAIVRALDLPTSAGGEPLQVLKSRLRDRQILLVLDNFEQVIPAAVGVAELIQHCPDLRVVVTSRETLRVRAERVFPVPPLSLPDPRHAPAEIASSEAVQLFTERARAVQPGFTIDAENAAMVAEICLRLDGLPLALELAAARLNVFTPSELKHRLEERLDVLGTGGRDLPDRQRTLWAAIGWSYELLDQDERDMFELMSVFSGARLPDIEAVARATLDVAVVVDRLASLVDKSLIRGHDSGPDRRFSMLLTIKEYAQDRLAESPEREEAERRSHAILFSEYALRLENRLRGAERECALEELAAEIGNLRAAWSFWVETNDVDQLLGLLDALWALHEAHGWYQAAIELANDALDVLASAGPSEERAAEELTIRMSLARAVMAVHGYGTEAETAFNRALELSAAAGTPTQRFPVLRAMATYYMGITEFARASELGAQLIELSEEEGDETMKLEGSYVYGVSTAFSGDLETGMQYLDRVIEQYDARVHGSTRFRLGPNTGVVARVASGLILWQCGALEDATARLSAALEMAWGIDHPYSIAYALYHNGLYAFYRSRFEECLGFAGRLAVVADENDYSVWRTLAYVLEGVSRAHLGQAEEGVALTEKGIDLYSGLSTPPVFWPQLLMLRSIAHAQSGHLERALELIDEAIAVTGDGDMTIPELRICKGDVLMLLQVPDPDGAEAAYASAARGSEAGGLHLIELQARTGLVRARRASGGSPDGSKELEKLYASFTQGLEEHPLVMARETLGLGLG
jgi:predicted ATPase/class 3 adenylate cyclase